MQRGAIFLDSAVINMEFPSEGCEVMPGVLWGAIEAFPTPAYWAYQVIARRILGNKINYKLGSSLKEEVGACLLGGHGIPASIGIAAYQHVKKRGAFGDRAPDETSIFEWLSEPLNVNGRSVRYRFARQKSRYLAAALHKLEVESAPLNSGQSLRNWLLDVPGIGLKTASWTARNWLDADDVAILDIHVLRAGILGGFFQPDLTVERDYLKLEEQFIAISKALGVRASELDSVIWLEMMSSPRTVHGILESQNGNLAKEKKSTSTRRAKQRHTNPNQTPLLI
jgi:N-glycosylase/DNA lyase